MTEYTPDPLLVLRLRGSQAEMGAQHGAMLTELGGWQETRDFYASMPAALANRKCQRATAGSSLS